MGHLIDDLLHFSRTSRLEIQCRRVDPSRIIDAVLKENDFLDVDRNVAWKIDPLKEAYADPGLIRIVWTNLISNALKFTTQRDPARIHIGCLSCQEARSILREKTDKTIREDQNQVVFFVQDNGVGFDQQYADKLFGVFQRLHQNDEFEGTGIGLAIVKQIIRRHGGSVWAEGQVNEGATFYFSLEAYEADRPSRLEKEDA
jgi:light-regulated signal transduction histidine kinase (bacteriophytochrome)